MKKTSLLSCVLALGIASCTKSESSSNETSTGHTTNAIIQAPASAEPIAAAVAATNPVAASKVHLSNAVAKTELPGTGTVNQVDSVKEPNPKETLLTNAAKESMPQLTATPAPTTNLPDIAAQVQKTDTPGLGEQRAAIDTFKQFVTTNAAELSTLITNTNRSLNNLGSLGNVVTNISRIFASTNQSTDTSKERAISSPETATNVLADLTKATFSSDLITQGLKEALAKGLQRAIAQLGKTGGFLTNIAVRIPIPERLQPVEKTLRRLGQGQVVDQFITSMNHAAEQAVPVAAGAFANALKQMTIQDAQNILNSTNNAATEFFRRTTEPELQQKFLPIVQDAMSKVGATAAYQQLMQKVSFASPFMNAQGINIDNYVTTKAMDGLFKVIGDEERRIRQNPVARTSDVLKQVFGRIMGGNK